MTVTFVSGGISYQLVVTRPGLMRKDPVILPDKSIMSKRAHANVGLDEKERRNYVRRQRRVGHERVFKPTIRSKTGRFIKEAA